MPRVDSAADVVDPLLASADRPHASHVVRISAPSSASPGALTQLRIDVTPALPSIDDLAGPPPTLDVSFVHPDGRERALRVPLQNEVRCAYCLPTPLHPHCEHDCRSDPFSGRTVNISGYLTEPGFIGLRAEVVGLDATLEGAPRTIEVGAPRR